MSSASLAISDSPSASLITSESSRKVYNRSLFSRDLFIEYIKDLFFLAFSEPRPREGLISKCKLIEELVTEHMEKPTDSLLFREIPSIGKFHTPLHIEEAFNILDSISNISRRRHIPPSFTEIKDLLNLSQILAMGSSLGLVTFDGDQTLYDDGENFGKYSAIGDCIVKLLRNGVYVSVVTAAGYGLDGSKYEIRLRGLIDMFISHNLNEEEASRFYVCGGQCNYLLQCKYEVDEKDRNLRIAKLVPVPYEVWQNESFGGPRPYYWPSDEVKRILDTAEAVVREAVDPEADSRLFDTEKHLITIIRKERTIGIISRTPALLQRDPLNELCFRIKLAVNSVPNISIPFCVFNGGHDVWTDIGNKGVGITALQKFLNVKSSQTVHFGDQLLRQGNDVAARDAGATIWIANPNETIVNLARICRYFD